MKETQVSDVSISKLILCNVFKSPIQDKRFVYQDFYNNVIKPHSNNVVLLDYAMTLYYYGIHCRQFYDSMTSVNMQKSYAEHDVVFEQVVKLRGQVLSILEQMERNELPQLYLTNSQGKNRELVFSVNNLQEDILELLVNSHKEQLVSFYNKYCEEAKQIEVSHITIEFLNNWVRDSEEEHINEGIGRMGRPLSLEMLVSHRCIQELSLILRIDRLLDDKEIYANLTNISLSSEDYRLIYNLLDYFGLLFYNDAPYKTTQPNDIIKDRFLYFYKSNSLTAHRKDVEERIRAINICCSRIKRTIQNQKR